MCGSYSHSTGMAEISDFLKREVREARARYNIAPRQLAPIVLMTATGPELHHGHPECRLRRTFLAQ